MIRKIGVTRFLGTNCDQDVWKAIELSGSEPRWLWFEDRFDPSSVDAIVIPGGFSYGDYLRAGALAARSPVMQSVREAAKAGVPILGICNGFQILCEAQLLPGALIQNESLRFIDQWVELNLSTACPAWAREAKKTIRLPIAHGQGRFYAEEDELKSLQDHGQVWWTYKQTPNGSLHDIAGIFNRQGNVAALMPHPERAISEWMSSTDGRAFFG